MVRLIIKISGEESLGEKGAGISQQKIQSVVDMILPVYQAGHQLSIVFGAGNWIRGAQCDFLDRTIADEIGMYATIMNALAVSAILHEKSVVASVFTPSKLPNTLEWDYREVLCKFNENQIVFFAGGTGNPFFSTDSAAALRGIQTKSSLLIKATKYGGIFDKDPAKYTDAKVYAKLSFAEVLEKN